MEKYIAVETVRKIVRNIIRHDDDVDAIMEDIGKASTSDVTPVRRAYWRGFTRNGVWDLACSDCDAPIPFGVSTEKMRYCHRCGARMDGHAQ